jgi:hypothetical protein
MKTFPGRSIDDEVRAALIVKELCAISGREKALARKGSLPDSLHIESDRLAPASVASEDDDRNPFVATKADLLAAYGEYLGSLAGPRIAHASFRAATCRKSIVKIEPTLAPIPVERRADDGGGLSRLKGRWDRSRPGHWRIVCLLHR